MIGFFIKLLNLNPEIISLKSEKNIFRIPGGEFSHDKYSQFQPKDLKFIIRSWIKFAKTFFEYTQNQLVIPITQIIMLCV